MNNILTYSTYLNLERILSSQQMYSDGVHDEMLFIIIHQTYELWFKQILFESEALKIDINDCQHYKILHKQRRMSLILKLITSQIDILETMLPDSFMSFREYLGSSSGFQSEQFRQIEQVFGIYKREPFISFDELNAKEGIWCRFLKTCIQNIQINKNLSQKFNEIESLLLTIYYEKSIYTEIIELFLDIDEKIQEWRYKHLKLVERMIGPHISGTGGSTGVAYLKQNNSKTFCPELWKLRNTIFVNNIKSVLMETVE